MSREEAGAPGAEGGEGGEAGGGHKGGIYTALLTRLLRWRSMKVDVKQLEAEYGRVRAQLGRVGWISQGYAQDRGRGAGGPCYQWTRKVKGKTVSVALSPEQYGALQQAIANWRQLQDRLRQMQALSRQFIFGTLPDTQRRKRLTKKVLGLN